MIRSILAISLIALASCSEQSVDAPAAAPRYPQEALKLSGGIYSDCAACHGPAGEGGLGPAFKANDALAQTRYAVAIVLKGTETMPGFAEHLTDAEIASVLTTIRTLWGNDFGAVDVAEIADARSALASANEPTQSPDTAPSQ